MRLDARENRGIALIIALLVLSVLSALGLGLSLVVSMDPLAAANQRESVSAHYVARAGLELAARELATAASWDAWLSGLSTSTLVDGPVSGSRSLSTGESIDIERLTNQLVCGRDATCTDAQATAVTRDRPWGADNPRWRPFLYGSTVSLGLGQTSEQHYVIAWVGDDGAERDGRPDADGIVEAGGGIVRVVVQAFGPFRSRQSVEAHISRRCELIDGTRVCEPGIRVQGWKVPGS
jgi:Tfp pilus assembly protein PilX